MTIRNLDALFEPKSIALIGASNQPRSVGAVLARNLFEAGFNGPILTVNPHEQAIRSTLNYRSVAELPTTPDLAVLATPPAAVPGLITELGARGCRAAIVVTAGFGEGERAEGELLRKRMLEASRPHLLRIIGPNCLGVISPGRGINASFAHLTPPASEEQTNNLDDLLKRLEAEGHLRLAKDPYKRMAFKPIGTKGKPASQMVIEDRE